MNKYKFALIPLVLLLIIVLSGCSGKSKKETQKDLTTEKEQQNKSHSTSAQKEPKEKSAKDSSTQNESKNKGVSTVKKKSPDKASKVVICIDPGHPSETSSGKFALNGTTENHINWVMAGILKEQLEKEGYQIVLTKQSEDELVKNKVRAQIANQSKSLFMIRLHCDAGNNSGFTFYYPDKPGSVDGVTGPSPEVIKASKILAQSLSKGMGQGVGLLSSRGVLTDTQTLVGGKQGALTGSIYAEVPVVTLEMCYLSNKQDAEFIKSADNQNLFADKLAKAIVHYVEEVKRG